MFEFHGELLRRTKDGGYTHCDLTLSLTKKISALALEIAYEMVVM